MDKLYAAELDGDTVLLSEITASAQTPKTIVIAGCNTEKLFGTKQFWSRHKHYEGRRKVTRHEDGSLTAHGYRFYPTKAAAMQGLLDRLMTMLEYHTKQVSNLTWATEKIIREDYAKAD